jgi:hypothetical protein
MEYEFRLFESIINGPLSPFRAVISGLDYRTPLEQKHSSCHIITTATFKKQGKKYELHGKTVVNSLNPNVYKELSKQGDLFESIPTTHLAAEVLTALDIQPHDVSGMEVINNRHTTTLRIKQEIACSSIPDREARYYYYTDLINDEIVRIKQEMQKTVFEFRTPNEIELYIHNMQQSLINLCYQLLKQMGAGEQNNIYSTVHAFTKTDILNYCFIALEKLLRFLEKHYLKYLDGNIQIPFRSSLIKTYQIPEKLELVKAAILKATIDAGLLKIVYTPLLKLNSVGVGERITYRELIYCNTYLDAFYDEINSNDGTIHGQRIIELLYQVNYNCKDLQLHEINRLKERIAGMDQPAEKIDFLYHCLKLINQSNCHVTVKFDPRLPSLRTQISTWIEEEISYLSKHLALITKVQPVNLFSDQEKPKLQSGFTVAQLALFFRLQADAGIITHKAQIDIFKHIAENYKTSKAFDISPDSVKNRFYNIDSAAVEAVKEKTIEILNQLKAVQPGY